MSATKQQNKRLREMLRMVLPLVRGPRTVDETRIIKCAARMCDEPGAQLQKAADR